jgi:uncharacterized protein (TIGR00288 family)
LSDRLASIISLIVGSQTRIALFVDGRMSKNNHTNIIRLRNELDKLGSIRVSTLFFDHQVDRTEISGFKNAGYKIEIIPKYITLKLAMESIDTAMKKMVDTIIIGSDDEEIFQVVSKIKENHTIIVVVSNSQINPSLAKIADLTFSLGNLDELRDYVSNIVK